MRVILIGKSSGRLDCLAEAFANSRLTQLFILTNYANPGLCTKGFVSIGATEDTNFVGTYADIFSPTIAVISNEEPLATGVVDRLLAQGIPTIGPPQAAAQIETSKIWTRRLLTRYNLGHYNPQWCEFTQYELEVLGRFVRLLNDQDKLVVVKPEGLTGGKGVRVQGDHFTTAEDAIAYAREIFATGGRVLIEQKLDGEEFSRMCFSDGKTIIPMPAVQDHKRLGEGDTGINTGGMGSYSDSNHSLPFLDAADLAKADWLNETVIHLIEKETGKPYIGILYGNFIATADGVRLIEYNARFGDPEVMNVLPLLETDFGDLCFAMTKQTLEHRHVQFADRATVCKYLLPKDYPVSMARDRFDISRIESHPDLRIYYGAVDYDIMTGSRALAVVGIGATIAEAEQIAERAAQQVDGPVYHRRDIGTSELIARRVEHVRRLRVGQSSC